MKIQKNLVFQKWLNFDYGVDRVRETFEKILSDVIGNLVGDQKFLPFLPSLVSSRYQTYHHLPMIELAVLESLREESTLSKTALRACIHTRSPSEWVINRFVSWPMRVGSGEFWLAGTQTTPTVLIKVSYESQFHNATIVASQDAVCMCVGQQY